MPELKATSIPFVAYDLFGYLLPGVFFLAILIFEFDMGRAISFYLDHGRTFTHVSNQAELYKLPYLMKFLAWEQLPTDFKVVPFVLLLVGCYLLGHIIAALSSAVLEKVMLALVLGYPSNNLFRVYPRNVNWFRRGARWCAERYCSPLNGPFAAKFKEVMDERFGYVVDPHDYYWLSFTDIVRYLPSAYQRTMHFVSLYGFTRNTCAAFLLYVPLRLLTKSIYWWLDVPFALRATNWLILGAYVLIGFFLFVSYLKHYRRQTVELIYAFYGLHTINLEVEGGTGAGDAA